MRMRAWGKGLLNEDGAAMTEYGLLLACIASIIIIAAMILGEVIFEMYERFPGFFPDLIRKD